jgi:hypothetical protein
MWVLRRRRRPCDPTFHGTPLPRRGHEEQERERTAQIILTYVRPFTAWPAEKDEHVWNMEEISDDTWNWEREVATWFEGRVLTLEIERYVQNFLAVVQARPDHEQGDGGHDDDVYEDVGLTVQSCDLSSLLKTSKRKGGNGEELEQHDEEETAQTTAMSLGKEVWGSPKNTPLLEFTDGSARYHVEADEIIKAAQDSEKNSADPAKGGDVDAMPACTEFRLKTAREIRAWVKVKKETKNKDGTAIFSVSILAQAFHFRLPDPFLMTVERHGSWAHCPRSCAARGAGGKKTKLRLPIHCLVRVSVTRRKLALWRSLTGRPINQSLQSWLVSNTF